MDRSVLINAEGGNDNMEKSNYKEPQLEFVEIEVNDIMTESGMWTDPFSLDWEESI